MAKSLFGGGAVVTGALLLGSLLFYAHPSIAENLAQQNKQDNQIKTETTGTSVPADNAPAAAIAENVKPPDAPVRVDADLGPPPPEIKKPNAPTALNIAPQLFTATAYALRGRTSSGRTVARGLIAADGRVLPLGTRVRLEAGAYSGEYIVADRGGAVRGRRIDIWMPTTGEARRFGRRAVKLTVLNYSAKRAPTSTRRH
ncbi:MAG TPA: 3D domain-containing protein [Pyrinomonadaceae bacterium]|nr:3D domain-containing protein [Pyrinomonadaceae bacterium]